MDTLIFIPTFNCQRQIDRVLKQFLDSILNGESDVLIVDNRSTDQTIKAVIDFFESSRGLIRGTTSIEVLQNDQNISLGGSHKVAFKYATERGYSKILVIHGDDQASLQDLDSHVLKKANSEAILGARFHPQSYLEGYSIVRSLGNKLLNFAYSLCFMTRVYDMGSGLNIFNRSIFSNPYIDELPNDLTFNNALLAWLLVKNIAVQFEPISWRETDQVSNARLIKQTVKIIWIIIYYRLNIYRLKMKRNTHNVKQTTIWKSK